MDYDRIEVEPLEVEDLYAIIYKLVSEIPEGSRTTYGLIAEALGDKIASRAVGEVLSRNPRPGRPPRGIPCHRVLYADGSIGKYAFGSELKEALLREEGVEIVEGKALGEAYKPRYVGILSARAEEQRAIREVAEESSSREVREFRGKLLALDAAYKKARVYDISIGVAALIESPSYEIIDVVYALVPVSVPYISTYLAYRELQVFYPLAEYFLDSYELLVVNGHGLSHPRAGIASHLGFLLDVPSIGVARRLLRGTKAIKASKRYLSPGFKSSVYRVYKAIEIVDRISKKIAKKIA